MMTPYIFAGLGNETKLHIKFKELITKYGGMNKVANDIECELIKFTKVRHIDCLNRYSKSELEFLKDYHGLMNIQELSVKLGRSYSSVQNKVNRMQHTGKLGKLNYLK